MPHFRGTPIDDSLREGVIAIGNFDGVHRGHQAMIQKLRRVADMVGTHALAVTFNPAPVELLRPEVAPPRLMTLEDKIGQLKAIGADRVLPIATTPELLGLTASEFFDRVLVGDLKIKGIVEGPNFHFGKGREGNTERLAQYCSEVDISLTIVPSVFVDGTMVSSSRIRDCVTAGDMTTAHVLLGRPHRVIGRVVRGAARGATLGFPTANLADIDVLLPPPGVYAGFATLEGRRHEAAIHIGPNVTFGERESNVEVHVLDFSGDLYDRRMTVHFIAQVRPSQTFSDAESLIRQMTADCEQIRGLLADVVIER